MDTAVVVMDRSGGRRQRFTVRGTSAVILDILTRDASHGYELVAMKT